MKNVYLIGAIVGAAIPLALFAQHFEAEGLSIAAFVAAAFANPVAGGGWSDLLISSFVFWIWMFTQRGDGPRPWLFVVLNLFIGLSCALPAWLYARERLRASA